MLRQANIRRGSGAAELFLKTERYQGTGNMARRFPMINASRIELVGMGIAVSALTGTSVRAQIRLRNDGNPGGIPLKGTYSAPVHGNYYTGVEQTAVGWWAIRAGVGDQSVSTLQPASKGYVLGHSVGGNNGFAAHNFDTNESGEVHVCIIPNADVTVLDCWAWAYVRVYRTGGRDDTGNFGYEG